MRTLTRKGERDVFVDGRWQTCSCYALRKCVEGLIEGSEE